MKRFVINLFTALGLFVIAGCAAPRQAITLDADAFHQHISTIYVMPVIDGRNDKSAKLDDTDFKRIREMTKEKLEKHGYQTVLVDSWGAGAAISDQSLADMSAAELSGLAPVESKIFLIITINDIHDKWKVFSASYSITGTAMAIDRGKKTEIWKDAATGAESSTGILGAMGAQIGKADDAQHTLLRQVFASFPKNIK